MSLSMREPMSEQDAGLLNALQLAYIGDTVWEVLVRNELIRQGLNLHHMHSKCVGLVNAHAQACFFQQIQEELTDKEQEIVRRGRNAHQKHPVPKNQLPEDYASATGFEALIGFLYLTGNEDRILSIFYMTAGGQKDGGTKKAEG